MNITELARLLKITPQELRKYLPRFGYDIGRRAIKINRGVANRIIKEWPELSKKIAEDKRIEAEKEDITTAFVDKNIKIRIPKFITVRDLSSISGVPISAILSQLMKSGIFASLNEKIDFETAWLIGSEMGIEVKLEKDADKNEIKDENKLEKILENEDEKNMLERPPVIVVMGHVDHGKTKLLDAIRKTDVVADEAGGITQHIGAYQVKRKNQIITFIDTPGHEAFTAMRGRGAKIADIAILVVAADDGVKPQTVEAFRIIKASKIPYVVAINKIDKSGANIEKTKQELSSQLNIVPEDWGGKIICQPISALNGTGIDELLDIVLLTAETDAKNIKANPEANGVGTVIESNLDKGTGPIATILVQNGTLKIGDQLTLNNIIIGKVRCLNDFRNQKIKKATPATPVQIIGLKILPEVGDMIETGDGEKVRHKKTRKTISAKPDLPPETTKEKEDIKKVNIIIKADMLGSAEAIEESLAKINTDEVKTKIIHKGLGNITDGDLKRAEATGAKILGFNIKVPPAMEEIAREKNIEIKLYSIIYDLINEIKEDMLIALDPKFERIDLGRLKILAIFKTDKNGQIIGGKIIEGQATADASLEIVRGNEIIAKAKLIKLQAGKQDVQTVDNGEECGIQFKGKPIAIVGDKINFYKDKQLVNKL